MLKQVGKILRTRVFTKSQSISPKITTYIQRVNSNSIVDKLDRHHLNQGSNLTSLVIGQTNIKCLWIWCTEMVILSFPWYSCPKCIPESHQEETDKSKLRYILLSNWPVLMTNVKVKKNQVSLKNWFRLQETKETWQLNVIYDPGLDPGAMNINYINVQCSQF